MKEIAIFIILISLWSCNSESKELDIPWHVQEKINKEREFNYNFKDSLNKYESYNENKIKNLGNFYSYMSNLKFANNRTLEEAILLLEKSTKVDMVGFCDNLIYESYDYLKPNGRPSRRYTMPFILDLDIEYFIRKLKECNQVNGIILSPQEELELRMSYIMLKDQWFRIPDRKANPEMQSQFDEENRNDLNKLFEDFDYTTATKELRENIYILLLHSTDCLWTKKWLNIYMNHFKNYDKYENHLKHFLWRSSCDDQEIKERINNEINRERKTP